MAYLEGFYLSNSTSTACICNTQAKLAFVVSGLGAVASYGFVSNATYGTGMLIQLQGSLKSFCCL